MINPISRPLVIFIDNDMRVPVAGLPESSLSEEEPDVGSPSSSLAARTNAYVSPMTLKRPHSDSYDNPRLPKNRRINENQEEEEEERYDEEDLLNEYENDVEEEEEDNDDDSSCYYSSEDEDEEEDLGEEIEDLKQQIAAVLAESSDYRAMRDDLQLHLSRLQRELNGYKLLLPMGPV